MKLLQSIVTVILFFATTISIAQSNELDCKSLKKIKLKYTNNPDKTAFVLIKNKLHTEYLQKGKYHIKSDLEWVNDCEYNATITKITVPDFPFKVGDVMNVKFEKIEDGFVYATGSVGGNSFPIQFEIVK